jgi:uncharacterized protein with von Willebrand factor type A (vWA) domain
MPNFNKFIHFSNIAEKETRAKFADSVFCSLNNPDASAQLPQLSNFTPAVANIINNNTLREMCNSNEELSEKIAADILEFVNKTRKQIDKTENPFAEEKEAYQKFLQTTEQSFSTNWKSVKKFIDENYGKDQIDTAFYEKEFADCLDRKEEKSFLKSLVKQENKINFNSIKEHFTDNWAKLLNKKCLDWELQIIDEQRKKFCEELYKQIEQLKQLQQALEPFTNELGRLWDMSKGSWQRVNFDLLKQYAELLQKDKSLQEFAEMLGRMHAAETEYEEEIFKDIKLTTAWKTNDAAKSDMIGVYESDDLSSILPSEIALLANPLTEMVFYKKFAEKKLQTFEYQGRSREIKEEEFENRRQKAKEDKKGPFIICVDTSDSMHGTPETVAKMLCFAILKIAIRDNRKAYLISFSTGIETLNLSDLKNSLDKIIDFLSMSFYGGTDAIPAMHEALRMLETQDYQKADVIMVSDFVMSSFNADTQKKIAKAKANKTKFHSLVIGSSQNNQIINEFDNNWVYDVNNPNRVLGLVMNINTI